MRLLPLFHLLPLLFMEVSIFGQSPDLKAKIASHVDGAYPEYFSLYKHLHQNPELSSHEVETARRMADELRRNGAEVTPNFGGNGVVGIIRNGNGPVVMVRTDMDALPIEEKTGLPYASTVRSKDSSGNSVPVMHACGHDIHMTIFSGVAATLSKMKRSWKGTLILVAQQAEETNEGARLMLAQGLYEKFPVPDYALAYHVSSSLEAGFIGFCPGPALANVDDVDITVFGKGGHGAYPHLTVDPVVIASRIILDLQTIVSREVSPLSPAVVTVGSVHGGTQRNIIPDEVKLSLTVRTYTHEVRKQIFAAIERIAAGAALTAGMPADRLPTVTIGVDFTPAVVNNPALTSTAVKHFADMLGESKVVQVSSEMVGEDFGQYGQTPHKVPIFLAWLGTVDPEVMTICRQEGTMPPPLHSSQFAPHPEKTIKTGILAMSYALINLFNQPIR